VIAACKVLGHTVRTYDPASDLPKLVKDKAKLDVVWPALHGRGGEDGVIQGFLESLALPYVGSGVLGSALAVDKGLTKLHYRAARLPAPRGCIVKSGDKQAVEQVMQEVGLPCFVKPTSEGSSYGAGIVEKKSELLPALKKTWRYGDALVEELLKGRELTVGVLENPDGTLTALLVVEIRTKQKFFDLEAKYASGAKAAEELVPAPISQTLTAKVQTLAQKAHTSLGLRHLSRTDFIVTQRGPVLLETNTLPGFTDASLYPKMAAATGMTTPKLVEQLLRLARRTRR
jgi:D-alanine-D-alanine ligase